MDSIELVGEKAEGPSGPCFRLQPRQARDYLRFDPSWMEHWREQGMERVAWFQSDGLEPEVEQIESRWPIYRKMERKIQRLQAENEMLRAEIALLEQRDNEWQKWAVRAKAVVQELRIKLSMSEGSHEK